MILCMNVFFIGPHACGEHFYRRARRTAPLVIALRKLIAAIYPLITCASVLDPTRVGAIHERARYTTPLVISLRKLIAAIYPLITCASALDPTRVGEGKQHLVLPSPAYLSDPTRVGAIHERARYTSPLFIIDQGQLVNPIYSLITGVFAPDPTRVGGRFGMLGTWTRTFQTPRMWGMALTFRCQ